MRYNPYEMHIHEVRAHEMHACKVHVYVGRVHLYM